MYSIKFNFRTWGIFSVISKKVFCVISSDGKDWSSQPYKNTSHVLLMLTDMRINQKMQMPHNKFKFWSIRVFHRDIEKKKKNTPSFGIGQFRKSDILPTIINSCTSEQKTGLTQSSSLQSFELPVHTDQSDGPGVCYT
jgi:hypothetical protein